MTETRGPAFARDAQTLEELLVALEGEGYGGQFRVVDARSVQCLTCREESAPAELPVERLGRLEGASDPADEVAVAAIRCPHCGAAGTLVVHYGPDAPLEEAEAFAALPDERAEPGRPPSTGRTSRS